jgi:hypothetical protein
MRVSFKFLISTIGFLFVGLTGFFSFFVTWTFSADVIDDVSQMLRDEVVQTLSKEVIDVTSGVREQSLRGAMGPLGSSDFGCCSVESDTAKYVAGFEEVRRYHWENLQTNPNLLLSFSGTMAGSLILVSTTDSMDDIDGTEARGGQGNLQWTLSDASTNYTYRQYLSNAYTDGQFVKALTSLCGASFVLGSVSGKSTALTTKEMCDNAARELIGQGMNSTLREDEAAPHGCQLDPVTRQVTWNPDGRDDLEEIGRQALCKSGRWFQTNETFQPSCADNGYPCTQGEFHSVVDPDFDAALATASTSPYNATQRSWWKGAVENGASCEGLGCKGRGQPGWSKVYLSKSTGQLVLPSVFPQYVGTTDTVRSVITLGIGLRYLDTFIADLVGVLSPNAKGWIVDLSSTEPGMLLASFPAGLSTHDDQLTLATKASKAGSGGDYIEAVSKAIRDGHGGEWLDVPEMIQLTYEDDLVQAYRISDGFGLEWLFVLSVPREVFWGNVVLARDLTIVGVSCLTAVMCMILFVISCIVSRRLMALGEKMAEVADMRMGSDIESGGLSMYKEVYQMESSFRTMTQKLRDFWTDEQNRHQKREESHRRRLRTRVLSAISESDSLRHPMVLCKASNFIEMGSLRSYESLRDSGKLVVLDTMEKVVAFERSSAIVFFSHQWLGWGQPDPDNVHHTAMVNAIVQLQTTMRNPVGAGPLQLEDMYIWVDYCSISQEHRGMQMLAISSLPVYSSVAHAFVVIAPTTTHKHNEEVCDLCSYDSRGWCRVETLSKVCASGIDNMYVMDGVDSNLMPVTIDMFKENLSLRVFEGSFSCCAMGHKNQAYCDKEQLVQSILGLYFKTLSMTDNSTRKVVLEHIQDSKDRFFPAFFKFSLPDGREEERELFGDLVSTMEVHAEKTVRESLSSILEEDELPATLLQLQQQGSRLSSRSSKDDLALGPPMMAHRTII